MKSWKKVGVRSCNKCGWSSSQSPTSFALSLSRLQDNHFAKGVSAHLAALEVPVFEDTETNFHELRARIAKTVKFI